MMQWPQKVAKTGQKLDSNEDGIREEELIHDEIEKISSTNEPIDDAGWKAKMSSDVISAPAASKYAVNNDGNENDNSYSDEKNRVYLVSNKYAESKEKDLFYRLGFDKASDLRIESQIKRGCIPASLLAIICDRRGYYYGRLWNYEIVGCFFFLSSLVNLIPAFVRISMQKPAMGTTNMSKFIHAGQFLQFSLMWWLVFYYAHTPILASYGRLRFKRSVKSLISSEGMKFTINRKDIKVVSDKTNIDVSKALGLVSGKAPAATAKRQYEVKEKANISIGKEEKVLYCRLDMTNEKNIVAWNAIRHMSHHYASGMRLKLNIYGIISLVTVFVITAMPTIGVTILGIGTFPLDEHLGNLVRMVFVGGSLIASTLAAYIVDHYDLHIRDAVTRNQQFLQSELAHADPDDKSKINQLQTCNMLIQSTLKQIGVAHKAHPERMLMLRADPAVCSIIMTILGVAMYFDILRLQKTFEAYTQ